MIKIQPSDFRTLLTKVLPFTGTDTWFPVLRAVHLAAADGRLTARATDRYVVGVAHTQLAGGSLEPFMLDRDDARRLLAVFPVARKGEAQFQAPIKLAVRGDKLTATLDGADLPYAPTVTVKSVGGTYPNFTHILRDALTGKPKGDGFMVDPAKLQRFHHLKQRNWGLLFRQSTDSQAVVVVGDQFIGAVMPMRIPDGADKACETAAAEWSYLFPKPATTDNPAEPAA